MLGMPCALVIWMPNFQFCGAAVLRSGAAVCVPCDWSFIQTSSPLNVGQRQVSCSLVFSLNGKSTTATGKATQTAMLLQNPASDPEALLLQSGLAVSVMSKRLHMVIVASCANNKAIDATSALTAVPSLGENVSNVVSQACKSVQVKYVTTILLM